MVAALVVYDTNNGLVPPNWGHPIPKRCNDQKVFAETDEATTMIRIMRTDTAVLTLRSDCVV